MTLTCLMSVYAKNDPGHLSEAIESILAQTRKADEFLIVIDGPIPQKLQELLDRYKALCPYLRLLPFRENRGLGLALRDGILAAKGEWIARMDSDDLCAPDRFERQMAFLSTHPEIGLLGTNAIEFEKTVENPVSRRKMPEDNEEILHYAKTRNPFIHPSVVFRREDALQAGNYENWYLCEDYDLWVKMMTHKVAMHNLQEDLVFMRIDSDFYRRRGGWKYCRNILRFKRHLRKTGFMPLSSFLKSSLSSLVISLMPNRLREWVYKKYLRK